MRTIKFRGERIDGKGLAYGDLLTGCGYKKGRYFILPHLDFYPSDCSSLDGYEIIPNTIGQFTGLIDKNDKEIYEGDILRGEHYPFKNNGVYNYYIVIEELNDGHIIAPVCRLSAISRIAGIRDGSKRDYSELGKMEVIGNIHDNPKLLKGKNKKQ